ncbi:phytanoyl-CoA dioxygenase, peroxisomal-like isoform X2 [Anthonomus grandis grandis]|uniref:phytanoyl-CoA dioxygenase, peroxisomal-like isoform X2 n=1 Tax=Anthonomus grandis grandis TaxID=2921223 RepID=UPI002165A8A1|nr:phytanoyl-CoA dioxygenase, peroxisomal-like isoform X2 [Anthonomus grandis grandis]
MHCCTMAYKRSDLPKLTIQQKIFYEENGFLLIEKNVGDELIDELRQRFLDICNGNAADKQVFITMKDPSLKNTGVKGEYLINKLQDFAYDKILWKYISEPSVVDIVEALIGPNITAVHSMLINKPPNAKPEASLHPVHQDLHYFPFRPADKIIASWTAMERVDESNGCLHVVPGSHRGPLYSHSYPDEFKNILYHGIKETDNRQKHYVIMERGDTLFFHPLLLHGSGPNRTQGFRKAISCHYADSNCEFIDVRGTSQENIATEVEQMAVKLLGADVRLNIQDIWKNKSRLVRGKPGNFQSFNSHL